MFQRRLYATQAAGKHVEGKLSFVPDAKVCIFVICVSQLVSIRIIVNVT